MTFPTWVDKIGPYPVTPLNWGRWGFAYKGYPSRFTPHTTETLGQPDYGRGGSQPHLTIDPRKRDLGIRQHQSLNIGARALLGVSTNTADCIQVEQIMYSDRNIAQRVGGLWVGDLTKDQLHRLGVFYVALCELCGIPPVWIGPVKRLGKQAWLGRHGWGIADHAKVPQNQHWDCGVLDFNAALRAAGAGGAKAGEPAPAPKISKHGLTVKEVKSIQRACNDHFGASLTVDGVYGKKTVAAIRAAQHTLKVKADGIWGKATQNAYNAWHEKKRERSSGHRKPKPGPSNSGTLHASSRGPAVSTLQEGLRRVFPAYAGRLQVDGIFGPRTTAAVRQFQRRSNLEVDGRAGSATRAALKQYGIAW